MFKEYLCAYRFGWARKGWSAPGANDAVVKDGRNKTARKLATMEWLAGHAEALNVGVIETAEEALALWSAERKEGVAR